MTIELWTVGHADYEIVEFLELLESFSIQTLVDVRRFPVSQRQPHFQREHLAKSLEVAGISYVHMSDLGGRRKERLSDSPNGGWRVESFNAYADYALSMQFRTALLKMESIAANSRSAIMCSEAVPWRCHRQIIADAMTTRGWTVLDILSRDRAVVHTLPEFAVSRNGRVIYPELVEK